MSADARRVIYESNEARYKRIEEYRRLAWDCGKESGRWEGLEQGRREERERFMKLVADRRNNPPYVPETGGGRRGVYQWTCDDILAALEEPKP